MRGHVERVALGFGPRTVVDAYAGSGQTSLALAAAGTRVVAIEMDRDAVEFFSGRLPQGSRAIVGTVENELPHSLPADVVILNPPRSGLSRAVAQVLSRPGSVDTAVIYVSCNASTLARDLTWLPSLEIRSLDCFDMFPQTAHIETVCVLLPGASE
jgi:23S rRNA (uracil1939-C5)-methyltransferase